jgi:hypothetical protein
MRYRKKSQLDEEVDFYWFITMIMLIQQLFLCLSFTILERI